MGVDAPPEEGAQSDHDTVAPLPPPPSINAQTPPWLPAGGGSSPPYAEPLYAPTVSMASGYAPIPFQMSSVAETGQQVTNVGQGGSAPAARSDVNSSASGTSGNSSASDRKSVKKLNTVPSPLTK